MSSHTRSPLARYRLDFRRLMRTLLPVDPKRVIFIGVFGVGGFLAVDGLATGSPWSGCWPGSRTPLSGLMRPAKMPTYRQVASLWQDSCGSVSERTLADAMSRAEVSAPHRPLARKAGGGGGASGNSRARRPYR